MKRLNRVELENINGGAGILTLARQVINLVRRTVASIVTDIQKAIAGAGSSGGSGGSSPPTN
jgi:hypothetical protein